MTTQAIDLTVSNAGIKESLVPKTFFDQLAFNVKKIFESVFGENKEVAKTRPLAEGNFTELTYAMGDALGVIRKTDAVYNASMNGNPTSNFSNGILLGASITQAATGAFQFQRGVAGIEKSSENGDKVGLATSSIRVARGVTESVSGGANAAITGASIANATSKISKAMNILGWISMAGTGFTSGAIMVTSAIGLIESFSISTKLSQGLNNEESFQVLKDKLVIKDEDRTKILDQLFSGKKAPWYNQLASSFTNVLFRLDQTKEKEKLKLQDNLQKILKDPASLKSLAVEGFKEATSLSDQETAFITNYLDQKNALKALPKEQLLPLLKIVYQDELGRIISKKEAVFNRTVGSETFKLIEPYIKSAPSSIDMGKIVKSAKHEIRINQGINLTATLLGALGVAVTLMAQFATGGVYALVELGIGLGTSLAWVFVDGYSLYEAFKNNPSTTKDKIMMTLGVLLTFSTTVLAVIVNRITSHLAPVIALVTLSTLFMLYVVYKWKKASKSSSEVELAENKRPEILKNSVVQNIQPKVLYSENKESKNLKNSARNKQKPLSKLANALTVKEKTFPKKAPRLAKINARNNIQKYVNKNKLLA